MPNPNKRIWADNDSTKPLSAARMNGLETDVETLYDTYVRKGELVFNVKDYGAKGDGLTNDVTAINAAINAADTAGGGTVLLPSAVYAIASQIIPKANVRLTGYGSTVKAIAVMAYMISGAVAGFILEGIKFAANGQVTSSVITLAQNATGWTIYRCSVTDVGYAAYSGVEAYKTTDVRVEDCAFTGCKQGVFSNGGNVRMVISNNRISDYKDTGIYILGTAVDGVSTNLLIDGNHIHGLTTNTGNRYPIHSVSTDVNNKHTGLRVIGNAVKGRGTSYTNATTPGTADQISLHNVTQFTVMGNTTTDGGDMGITIESSDQGSVVGNMCARNDTGGIAIWNANAVAVAGNTCVNNGQNRQADRTPDTGRCGIICNNSNRIVISGNVLGDNQTTKTQVYGVSFQSSQTCKAGPDIDTGNITSLYYNYAAGSTAITQVSMVAV